MGKRLVVYVAPETAESMERMKESLGINYPGRILDLLVSTFAEPSAEAAAFLMRKLAEERWSLALAATNAPPAAAEAQLAQREELGRIFRFLSAVRPEVEPVEAEFLRAVPLSGGRRAMVPNDWHVVGEDRLGPEERLGTAVIEVQGRVGKLAPKCLVLLPMEFSELPDGGLGSVVREAAATFPELKRAYGKGWTVTNSALELAADENKGKVQLFAYPLAPGESGLYSRAYGAHIEFPVDETADYSRISNHR